MITLIQLIINKHITLSSKCRKLLSEDGITSQYLVVNKLEGLFENVSVNIRLQRLKLPSIGDTVSILKNLDEYQFIICSDIKTMPDINTLKLQLQKYRIAIIASFTKLIPILTVLNSNKDLQEWNFFAKTLLMEISETVAKTRTTRTTRKESMKSHDTKIKDTLKFFEVPENEIDKIVKAMY